MNLSGEVRESVSLDEDDLSDIEDEVFIRDGKRGYKFEDISVKKPLMAPRRKITKSSNISTRIRNKQSCKAFCKPLWCALLTLAALVGLIALVIILVSLFPLPIDKLKNWIALKSSYTKSQKKVVQCSSFEIKEIWKIDFPKLTSETAVRVVDVDYDGVDDVIFGFSTGNDDTVPSDIFCPIFMNTSEPCGGGIMALNGTNGNILWKHWLPVPVFDIICTADFNGDNISDCLLAGKSGLLRLINSKSGSLMWDLLNDQSISSSKINVYQPTIIPDLDNDNISDIVATHSIEKDVIVGHLMVISGKNGTILQQISTPDGEIASYCKPQLVETDGDYSILFGTGSLTTGGALYLINLKDLLIGNISASQVLYKDQNKGILSPSVLVDITGDGIIDIVSAIFNSTVIAVNGKTLKLLWNYTIPNSETLSVPVPGYFNNDNVTDFLIKYQKGPGFPVYYYSQTFILDGKTGKPIIYTDPFIDTVGAQMGGLTIQTDKYGYDWFLYWTGDCKNHEGSQDIFQFINRPDDEPIDVKIKKQTQSDLCLLRYNSTTVVNIYALSQFDQPPGFKIYSSENDLFNSSKILSPVDEAREYFLKHGEVGVIPSVKKVKIDEINDSNKSPNKYRDGSNFRHKNNNIPDLSSSVPKKSNSKNEKYFQNKKQHQHISEEQPDFDSDYEQPSEDWSSYPQNMLGDDDLDSDYDNAYLQGPENRNALHSNMKLLNSRRNMNNRDPRSKTNIENAETISESEEKKVNKNNSKGQGKKGRHGKALKKNLADKKYGVYDYQNVQNSQKRLLTDLNTLPNQILRETYFKNQNHKLKKSKFEVRDLNPQETSNEGKKFIEFNVANKTNSNVSYTLWDLESENEMRERKDGGFWRSKRSTKEETVHKVPRTTTVGNLVKPLHKNSTGIDLILVTYWVPSTTDTEILLENDLKCINKSMKGSVDSQDQLPLYLISTVEDSLINKCLKQRGVLLKKTSNTINNISSEFAYFNEISELKFGILTVHRLSIQCKCENLNKGERCAKFLDAENQNWSSYLGTFSDGFFRTQN